MNCLRPLIISVAAALSFAVGCSGEDPTIAADSEDLTQSIPFEQLDAYKGAAPKGLTVIKSKSKYVSFFGEQPPANVDFNKHWVVHVSLGMKTSGGHGVDIVKIEKTGTAGNKKLVVSAHATSPGMHCLVTAAITNPQITVRIKKQSGTPNSKLQLESEVVDCPSGLCEDLGGVCKSSPIDVTFGANCEDDFAMRTETGGACPAFNHSCCVPISCGGFAGLPCPGDATCIDDTTDSCDPNNGGADCIGVCSLRKPASGWCVKNSGDTCSTDADCSPGGCGGELCHNPQVSSGISTCECTTPSASCGCVNGTCAWYE